MQITQVQNKKTEKQKIENGTGCARLQTGDHSPKATSVQALVPLYMLA